MAHSNLEEIPLPTDQGHTVKEDSVNVISKTHKKSAKEMLQEALEDHKHTTTDAKMPACKAASMHGSSANKSQQPVATSSQSIVDELFKDFISKKFGGTLKESQSSSSKIQTKSSSVDDKISQILDMEISSIKSKTINPEERESSEKLIQSHCDMHEVSLPSMSKEKYKLTQSVEKQTKTELPLGSDSSLKQRVSVFDANSDIVNHAATSSPCLSTQAAANSDLETQPTGSITKPEAAENKQQATSTMLPLPVAKKLGPPKLLKMKLSSESLSLIKSTDHVDRDGRLWEEGEVVSSHSDKTDKDDDDDDIDSNDLPSETGSIASSNGQPERTSSRHKKKHKHKHKKKKKKSKDKGRDGASKSKDRDSSHAGGERKHSKPQKEKTHSRDVSSERESSKRGREKNKKRKNSHSRSRTPKHFKKSRSHSQSRSPSKRKDSTDSDRHLYSEWDARHYGDISRHRSRSKESSSERHKNRSRERSRSAERDQRLQIDKDKLRRIAIANALQNMKSGQGPLVDLTVVKSGGKSVQELTEFCKKISAKNKSKEDSDSNDNSDDSDNKMLSEDEDRLIHHPFKVREPSSNIILNIRNAKQLPVLTPSEKQAQQATLRLTFPVSSGSHHRASESEWVPVAKPVPAPPSVQPQSTQSIKPDTSTLTPVKAESIFPDVSEGQKLDISSIITERLQAVRRLQENPYDVQALTKMHKVQEQASRWAVSKHLPGQFVGSTGAHVLSQEELIGDKRHQAWARKTQLMQAAPVNGGIGMFLLQKMGWKQGEGLGKNNEGSKEPLLLDVKIDRKGLTAAAENPKQKSQMSQAARAKDLSNKHPVSALMELCNKRRWGPPLFTVVEESGPDHKKTFLFKVKINNVEYQPATASLNKKTAKAQCAAVCLQEMGLLPRDAKVNY